MKEVFYYFVRPEDSMAELLMRKEDKKVWQHGIITVAKIVILIGLLNMIIYSMQHAGTKDIIAGSFVLGPLMASIKGEGFIWLVGSLDVMLYMVFSVVLKIGAWVALLWLIKTILKDGIKLKELALITSAAIISWLVVTLIFQILGVIMSICPMYTIAGFIGGLGTIFSYWYLILIVLGYTIATRATFLKGAVIVLVIQGIFIGLQGICPLIFSYIA